MSKSQFAPQHLDGSRATYARKQSDDRIEASITDRSGGRTRPAQSRLGHSALLRVYRVGADRAAHGRTTFPERTVMSAPRRLGRACRYFGSLVTLAAPG